MDWTPTLADREGPVYRRIVEALSADIASGRLHRGQQLPTHRALAKALGIDLTTVTRAMPRLSNAASRKRASVAARSSPRACRMRGMPAPRSRSSTSR
jgi:DNA-binding transcriptional MocR family regulator